MSHTDSIDPVPDPLDGERGDDGDRSARAVETTLTERLRYLAVFLEYLAGACAWRALRAPRRRRGDQGDRLDVVALSAYPPEHYGTVSRFARWIPHLEGLGCDLEVLTPCSDRELAAFGRGDASADQHFFEACLVNQWRNVKRAAAADAVILHRGLFPFSPWQRANFERDLSRLNPHLVYDFYDAIWIQRQRASRVGSAPARWLHPADKIEQIMRGARIVTVSNDRLAEWARLHHADVRIVPMLLDVSGYRPREREHRSPVVLGWSGNRYQIDRLRSIAPALRGLAQSREIVVRVVSSEPVEITGVPLESVTHPWSAESERDDLASFDIGLLPLEATPHDRGKSPLKLLQYAAAGLAIVATPVAIDTSVMRPGEAFLPASTEDEWRSALLRLIDEPELRMRLGAAARGVVERHYGFAAYAQRYADLLRDAAR